MSALQIVRANKFMVEEGRMPTARDFQHYNLSEHFKTHRARMQNDMFKVGIRKAASKLASLVTATKGSPHCVATHTHTSPSETTGVQ